MCGNFFGFVFLFPSDAGFEASAAAEGYPSGPISNPKHCNYYYYVITFVVRKCVFLKYPGNRTVSDLRAHATGLDNKSEPRSPAPVVLGWYMALNVLAPTLIWVINMAIVALTQM